jgi:hypothetical protein
LITTPFSGSSSRAIAYKDFLTGPAGYRGEEAGKSGKTAEKLEADIKASEWKPYAIGLAIT